MLRSRLVLANWRLLLFCLYNAYLGKLYTYGRTWTSSMTTTGGKPLSIRPVDRTGVRFKNPKFSTLLQHDVLYRNNSSDNRRHDAAKTLTSSKTCPYADIRFILNSAPFLGLERESAFGAILASWHGVLPSRCETASNPEIRFSRIGALSTQTCAYYYNDPCSTVTPRILG